jgi:hypothetical protein
MIVTPEQLRRGTRHVGVDDKPHSLVRQRMVLLLLD